MAKEPDDEGLHPRNTTALFGQVDVALVDLGQPQQLDRLGDREQLGHVQLQRLRQRSPSCCRSELQRPRYLL